MRPNHNIFSKILVIQSNHHLFEDLSYLNQNIIYATESYIWINISDLKINFLNFVRVFENFYVLSNEGISNKAIVYDAISKHYHDIIDIEKNIDANKTLCNILIKNISVRKIIDFGCGTGLSHTYCNQNKVDILGVDKSLRMLAEAEKNGLRNTCHISQLSNKKYINQFYGAIASYVFHILQDYNDLEILCSTLKPNSTIVANFFKNKNIEFINKYFEENNWGITTVKMHNEFNHGKIYVYRKPK